MGNNPAVTGHVNIIDLNMEEMSQVATFDAAAAAAADVVSLGSVNSRLELLINQDTGGSVARYITSNNTAIPADAMIREVELVAVGDDNDAASFSSSASSSSS